MHHITFRTLSVALIGLSTLAMGADYPDKSIRWILPYPPGGGTDFIARPIAQKLSDNLGRQVLIDNRGGANGTLGMEMAAQAAPDGYTIVMAITAQAAINPTFYPKLPYDPMRDYVPITLLGTAPYVIVVNPSLPVKSLPELIALAKSKPGQLNSASSGTGGIPHLALEMLKTAAGVNIVHVPYKGGGPATTDLLGGQVQIMFSTISSLLQHIRSGRLRAIAVTSAERLPTLPDVAPVAQTLPGYEATTFFAMLAPAGTPTPIVNRLNREFVRVLASPEIKEKLDSYDFQIIGSTPDQLALYMRNEIARWAKVIKESAIEPE